MIEKAAAGYVCNEGSEYLCGECQFRNGTSRCVYFGPKVQISFALGSCNRWKVGDPEGIPWLEPYLTKIQLGYLENKNGFGCKRCGELLPEQHACKKVDKDSPGFTPGEISSKACCDFWEKDSKRGQMTDAELVKILKAPSRSVLRFSR